MNSVKIKAAALVLPVVVAGFSPSVYAFKVGGSVGVDLEYTDNAALASTGEVDDTIVTGRLAGTISEDTGPLTGYANASIRRQDYLDNTFSKQTYLNLGAEAAWEQIRNRLVWTVENFYDQISLNTLEANTPSNTEDTNAFRLSATTTIRVADRHTLTVTPSFRDFYYETSSNDNQQLGLSTGWAYQLDPTISLSLNGSFTDVDYDTDTLVPGTSADNERTILNLALYVTRARSRYDLNIGYTDIKRDLGAGTDGVTGGLTWEHDFTARSTIIAYVASDITDSSNIFLSSSIDPNTGSSSNVQNSNDVVRNNVFRVTYKRQGSVVGSSIWAQLRDLDYDTTPQDREVQAVGARISYAISPLVTGSVNGSYSRTKDTTASSTDKEYTVNGRLDYSLSRKLTANVGLGVQSEDSSSVASREYDELSIFAGIGYRLGR